VPSFYLAGAHLGQQIIWNPGEVHHIWIGFLPDALSAMTGLDMASFSGRAVPAEGVLPQLMLEACCSFVDTVPRQGLE
jgi:hypothetical protein